MQLWDWFLRGGIFMWFIVITDVLVIAVIIAVLVTYTADRAKKYLIVTICVAAFPMLIGATGHLINHLTLMNDLASVNQPINQDIYDAAMSDVMIPSIFGGISSIALLLLGLLGLKFR
jgi:hypothetical protein